MLPDTKYHAKFYAHALTRSGGAGVERLTQSLLNAKVDLNPHQVEAALFALHSPVSKGVLLADEVGLGKTIEAGLVICQLWSERKRHLLIVCPASLRKQWQCELEEKFNLPSRIVDAKSSREMEREGIANPFDIPQIAISSYQYAARRSEALKTVQWDCVVMDEAHKLRNSYRESNKVGQALLWALEDRRKLLLTATPLQNSINELYGVATLLDKTYFGDFATFRSRFANNDGDIDGLRDRLRHFCWRTLRRDVLAFVHYTERIPLTQTFTSSNEEHALYENVSDYLEDTDTYAFPANQRSILTMVVRKVLASSTPALIGTLERILARLRELQTPTEAQDEDLLAQILQDDPDILAELEEDAEDADEEDFDDEADDGDVEIDQNKLALEITRVEDLIRQARRLGPDTKTQQLLVALNAGWQKLTELGAEQKAVIFTESRRSMEFLRRYLEENGYEGKVVCFSGGGRRDETAEKIYRQYKEDHPEDHSAKPVMIRHAIIDAFRRDAKILIATEAGAEGINLQFCSMVVNYDLPWNPQRVEQRIGRCHRYGQKYDVVVVNFCNSRNAADVRVFQLLRDKFSLFEGLFGASNDVLGFVDQNGQTFEQRIHDILRLCRTREEIEGAFDKLQEELQEQIAAQREATCKAVLENLDDDVRAHLKIDQQYAKDYLTEGQKRFFCLSRNVLTDFAAFTDDEHGFTLHRAPEEGIPTGHYVLDRGLGEINSSLPYRPNSPLGEWAMDTAMKQDTPYAEIVFNVDAHDGRLAVAEQLRGQGGYMLLELLTLRSLDEEEHLLFSAIKDDGQFLPPDVAEKLFNLPATVKPADEIPAAFMERLQQNAEQYAKATAHKVGEANNRHFQEASDKLNRWNEDQIAAATHKIETLRRKQLEVERAIRQAPTMDEKRAREKEWEKIRKEIRQARNHVNDVEDETDEKRKRLLDDLQRRLIPTTSRKQLFLIRWNVI